MAVEVLLQKGWHLTPDGLEQCKQNGNRNTDSVVKAALNTDLREIGEKFLPDDINRGKVDYVQGPCVLQIQKLRNVSAPKENEDSQGAPRLLKFTFTDGHQNCGAVEIESLDKISLNTPPGTKVQLLGTVQIEHGFLLLSNKNTRFLGGTVDKMVETWQLKRSLAKQSRALTTGEGGAPPFVPFGQRITQDKQTSNRRDNFKSLETGKEKKEEDGEFEQQRQATIKEALQGKQVKTFGGMGKQLIQDRDVARIVEMGFSSEEATCALKQNQGNVELAITALLSRSVAGIGGQRGRGYQRAPTNQDRGERNERGDRSDRSDRSDRFDRSEKPERGDRGRGRRGREGRETEGEDVAPTRPSGPATLFDFLETKITIKDEPKSETKESSKKYDNQGHGGKTQSTGYTSRSQPPVTSKPQEQKSQGQGFSQNRRQNLPPRLANKYNRDTDTASGGRTANSSSRPNSSYGNYNTSKQSDGSERSNYHDRNNYRGSENRNNYGGSGAERSNYRNSDRNSYPNTDKNNYGSYENRNNYGQNSERRNYNGDSENRNNYSRGNYSSSDRNSNRDRSGRADNSERSQPRTSSYQKPDFSNPPPPIVYDSGSQYTYQQPSQPYRPNTVAHYNMNYNNSGQTEWGQQSDYQTAMSTVYMQNNGDAGSRDWRRGDKCLAQYSGDGQYYNAVIEAISPELPTCAVVFTEYGNSEEVYLDSLRPLPKYGRNDGSWGSGPKLYSSHSVKHQHSNMGMPQGLAYPPPIPGDESLFAANHITTMEFRRGGGGNSYQKRPDRQGGKNQPFYHDQGPPPTSHY